MVLRAEPREVPIRGWPAGRDVDLAVIEFEVVAALTTFDVALATTNEHCRFDFSRYMTAQVCDGRDVAALLDQQWPSTIPSSAVNIRKRRDACWRFDRAAGFSWLACTCWHASCNACGPRSAAASKRVALT
jgi:hypothetical protein